MEETWIFMDHDGIIYSPTTIVAHDGKLVLLILQLHGIFIGYQ